MGLIDRPSSITTQPLSEAIANDTLTGCDQDHQARRAGWTMAERHQETSETCNGGSYAPIGEGGETIPIISGGAGTLTTTAVSKHNQTVECE